MRFVLAIVASLAFAITAVGCGGNACTDACEKVKTCAKNIDCAGDLGCELLKGTMSNVDCNAGNNSECSGTAKESADKINGCTLDSKTCACK